MGALPAGPASPPTVLVIGGGLAGIAASCSLVKEGIPATLVEKRTFLGGRAFSFYDQRMGQDIDNGQHVFMKCCTAYLGLLRDLGVRHKVAVQPRLSVPVMQGGATSRLRRAPLPQPFHLLPGLLAYRFLSPSDKLRVLGAAITMLLLKRSRHPELDRMSFRDWLLAHRQSERAIRNLWDLVVLATCNDRSAEVSADQGIMVFQEGFLKSASGADIGYATVGLTSLLTTEASDFITQRGGKVLFNHTVSRLLVEDGRIAGAVLLSGERLEADCYIGAVPYHALASMLPPDLRHTPFFAALAGLKSSPIMNVHLWLDRPITNITFTALLDSDLQWMFNKNAMGRQVSHGQYLCFSISGAHKYTDMDKDAIQDLVVTEVRRLFPPAERAGIVHCRIIKERTATFSPMPGARVLRPGPVTPLGNFFLAGEWTATDWPSTMESAVRSGRAAARAALERTVPRA